MIRNQKADKWMFAVAESSPTSAAEIDGVKAVTIPAILHKFEGNRIDILKLDIEGAEYALFKNGAESWLGAVGQIVIELHDRFQSGCAQVFYAAIGCRSFTQEIRGENVFIKFRDEEGNKRINATLRAQIQPCSSSPHSDS